MSLLPVEDALERLIARSTPVEGKQTLSLAEAEGLVLAEDVVARLTQPPFDASAMDGYALRAEDADAADIDITVIGMAAAGHAFDGEVGKGQAVRIFTGAPVPKGADAILIQEDATRVDTDTIRTGCATIPGRHIRPAGQDFAEGEVILQAGTVLDYRHLTLAAAANHPALCVFRKPLVAIIATGDELIAPGEIPGPGQIVASSGAGVAALARKAGADILDLGIVRDEPERIEAAIARAEASGADVLITLGGASVGDHDLVQGALKARGMELDFWRIAMRPGKPLMVGSIGRMLVLGLPGNPVAGLVCGVLFMEPVLRRIARRPSFSRLTRAVTATPLKANDHRQDYLRARLVRDESGQPVAESYPVQDSSMMKILSRSDCLIVRPPHAPAIEAGSACEIVLLGDPADH